MAPKWTEGSPPLSSGTERNGVLHSSLAASLIGNGLLMVAALSFLNLRFDVNDDPGMLETVSGATTGIPDPHLLYTNILLGRLLALLYHLTSSVPWYGLYLYAAHYAAMTALGFATLRRFGLRFGAGILLLVWIVFELQLLMKLQFTSTAILAGVSGIILICTPGTRNDLPGATPGLLGGFLVVGAAMIRSDSFLLALGLGSLLTLWSTVKTRSKVIPIALVSSALGGFALLACDAQHYGNDPEWSRFFELNEARGDYHDGPYRRDFDRIQPWLASIGWSPNDLEMLDSWFFPDPATYSPENLQYLADQLEAETPNVGQAIRRLVRLGEEYRVPLLMCLACLGLSLLLSGDYRWKVASVGFGQGLLAVMVFVYLSVWRKVPDRVVFPTIMGTALLLIHLAGSGGQGKLSVRWESAGPSLKAMGASLFILFGAITAHQAWMLIHLNAGNAARNQALEGIALGLAELAGTNGGKPIILNWGGGIPTQYQSPLSAGGPLSEIHTIRLGLKTHSPLYRAALQRASIEDLVEALYLRDDIFIVPRPGTKERSLPTLTTFIDEHRGRLVEFGPVRAFHFPGVDPEFQLIQVFKKAPSPDR